MKKDIQELEILITKNLQLTNNLKNEIEKKELEKQDQLRNISLNIIEIIDSWERVEESLIEKDVNKNEEVLKALNRFKTIEKKLQMLLQKYGITRIDFPDNRLIVGLCEVVDHEVDNNRKNDEIISVVSNGYIRGKDLIRAAQVIIVKN
jgi:molecular chaperone GrpE (heat shock protein)